MDADDRFDSSHNPETPVGPRSIRPETGRPLVADSPVVACAVHTRVLLDFQFDRADLRSVQLAPGPTDPA